MRERILAVVGAIGLIVGAIFLRGALAGDDSADDRAGGDRGSGNSGAPVVACEPDLQSVCDALVDEGAITAAPALGLSGAAADDLVVDGWITWDPAPGVANFDRPDTWADTQALASAPLGVLSAAGSGLCGPTSTWLECVVASVEQGAPVGVGNGTTAQSLARLHPIAGAFVPDEGDFTQVSASALRSVIDSTQLSQTDYARQVNTFLTQRGALQLVVGPVPALDAAAGRQASATVATPTPAAQLTAVVATRKTVAGDQDPIDASSLLESEAALDAFERLGLEPGTGNVAGGSMAGDVYSIREKVR